MPIRRIFYSGRQGADIHLLRSQTSRDLTTRSLGFTEVLPNGTESVVWARDYLNAHTGANADVTLEFRPTFAATLAGNEWTGFGIRVNKDTGVVSFVFGPAPDPAPTNFIIEAVITKNTGGIAPASITPVLVRVHVHFSAARLWVTPSRMTVRRLTAAAADDTRYRFAARVQFDDNIVGDVTTLHGVTWSPPANIHTTTGSDAGMLRIPAGVAAGAEVDIEAKWTTPSGTVQGTAKMAVAAPWATDPAMPKATIVDGHPDTWAGIIKPEAVPNVLIFGDGFTSPDQPAFGSICNKLVHDLKRDELTIPYNLLATSMNYWRVSVPAASRGISVRCEVFTVVAGGQLFAKPVPPALVPPAAGAWTLENLIYAVGLPMPTDVAPAGETAPQAATVRGNLRARWTAVARTAPTAATVSDAVIDEWRRLGTRTFIDEVDAFPAVALGDPPEADQDTAPPLLRLHRDRGGDEGLGAFYRALSSDNGVSISAPAPDNRLGLVWAEDRATFNFDNRSLVVMLAGIKGGRAQRTDRHIDMSLESGNLWMRVDSAVVGGRTVVTLDQATPLPATVDRDVWRVMAHELGHSFGLGDEYSEEPGAFNAPETSLDSYANLTSEAAVLDSANKFRADLVKWNWRRIRKAAVIRDLILPPPSGTDFTIKVLTGHALQFVAGDKIRLRARVWKKALNRDPFESATELEFVASNATGDEMTVRGAPGPLDPLKLPVGSIAYIPLPAVDGTPGDARMIAPKIAAFMQDNNRPLTPWPCDPAAHLGVNAEGKRRGSQPQIPAFNGYTGLRAWTHRNDVHLVGLYAGGRLRGCGIYHPSGYCMMRNSHSDTSAFCPVCRFVMVDLIDPFKHFQIDRLYAEIYPD